MGERDGAFIGSNVFVSQCVCLCMCVYASVCMCLCLYACVFVYVWVCKCGCVGVRLRLCSTSATQSSAFAPEVRASARTTIVIIIFFNAIFSRSVLLPTCVRTRKICACDLMCSYICVFAWALQGHCRDSWLGFFSAKYHQIIQFLASRKHRKSFENIL